MLDQAGGGVGGGRLAGVQEEELELEEGGQRPKGSSMHVFKQYTFVSVFWLTKLSRVRQSHAVYLSSFGFLKKSFSAGFEVLFRCLCGKRARERERARDGYIEKVTEREREKVATVLHRSGNETKFLVITPDALPAGRG